MQQPVSNHKPEDLSLQVVNIKSKNQTRSRLFTNLLVILKILVGILLLIVALQDVQFVQLEAGIRSANPLWLLLTIAAILFGLFLKLYRWTILVRNYHIQASINKLFSAYFVGQAANILLPLRGGELIRIGYLTEEKKVLPEAVSTIIIEKYLDLIALTVCEILVSMNISVSNNINYRGWLLLASILISIGLLLAIIFGPSIWQKIRDRNVIPRSITYWLDQWVHASEWLRQPKKIFPCVVLTIIIWGVMWLTNLLLFQTLGLPLNRTAGGVVLVFIYIGLFPALMPGNIGPFYFFGRLALLPFGIIQGKALVYTVLLHAIVTLPPLIGGFIGLFIRSPRPLAR